MNFQPILVVAFRIVNLLANRLVHYPQSLRVPLPRRQHFQPWLKSHELPTELPAQTLLLFETILLRLHACHQS